MIELFQQQLIYHILKATAYLACPPQKHMWLDYDDAADVLYVHFAEKPFSNHSEMRDDGIVLDYADNELVGMTILEASSR